MDFVNEIILIDQIVLVIVYASGLLGIRVGFFRLDIHAALPFNYVPKIKF